MTIFIVVSLEAVKIYEEKMQAVVLSEGSTPFMF
jgi:hypothetical protein